MIQAVKEDVLQRLMQKRLLTNFTNQPIEPKLRKNQSSQPQQDKKPTSPGNEDTDSMNPKKLKNHAQILNMLERLEQMAGSSPQALSVFIQNAEKSGVYKSIRDSKEFRKINNSQFNKSIDTSRYQFDTEQSQTDRFKSSRSVMSQLNPPFPSRFHHQNSDMPQEIPPIYTKLATFKNVRQQQHSEGTSPRIQRRRTNLMMKGAGAGGFRNSEAGQALFNKITDLDPREHFFRSSINRRPPHKLDKLSHSVAHHPLNPIQSTQNSILKNPIIKKGNQRYGQSEESELVNIKTTKKQVELMDSNESFKAGGDKEKKEQAKQKMTVGFKEEAKQASSKDQPDISKTKTQLLPFDKDPEIDLSSDVPLVGLGLVQSSKPVGGAVYHNLITDISTLKQPSSSISKVKHVSIEQIIIKKTQIFAKMPKLPPLVEKSEKFHELYKRMCSHQSEKQQQQAQQQQQQSPRQSINDRGQGNSNGNQQQQNNQQQSQDQILINQIGTGSNPIKNLRLSKQNLKAHITKRYGKLISERLMILLEQCNKTMHNIEYNAYLDLVYYSFFSVQNVTINGEVFQIPNMFKMMYQIFDGGNKGFICEHDIFQIFWSINQGKQDVSSALTGGTTPPQLQNQQTQNVGNQPQQSSGQNEKVSNQFTVQYSSYPDTESVNLSIFYKDAFPQIKRSVFVEAFSNDYMIFMNEFQKLQVIGHLNSRPKQSAQIGEKIVENFIRKELQAPDPKDLAIEARDSQTENQDNNEKDSKSQKSSKRRFSMASKKSTSNQGTFGLNQEKKKNISYFNQIVEQIQSHNKTALQMSEDRGKQGSSNNQEMAQLLNNQNMNVSANAFSHFNPVSQMMREKKNYSKEIQDIMKQDTCRQMNFEQFLRVNKFDQGVPQFLDDLFNHMTTLSLREMAKKQASIIAGVKKGDESPKNKKNAQKDHKYNANIMYANPFLNLNLEEINIMRRQTAFLVIMKNFQEADLKALMQGFIILCENGKGERNIMNNFISQQSIINNFKKVFKVKNETLALRFYNVLSKGVPFDRIYLPTYLTRVYPLFSNDLGEQMHFIFNIYDSDNDGLINSKDISDFFKNVLTCPGIINSDVKSCKCPLSREFEKMYKEYVKQNLLTYRVKKQLIDFEFFLKEVSYTSLIEEFVDKLTLSWDRPSIFSHDSADMALTSIFNQIDKDDNYNKINYLNSIGISNSCDNTKKSLQKFNNEMQEAIFLPYYMKHQAQELIAQQMNQQTLEEEYTTFMLQVQKAESEIERIMELEEEVIRRSHRFIKRKHIRIAVGLDEPSDSEEEEDQSPTAKSKKQTLTSF